MPYDILIQNIGGLPPTYTILICEPGPANCVPLISVVQPGDLPLTIPYSSIPAQFQPDGTPFTLQVQSEDPNYQGDCEPLLVFNQTQTPTPTETSTPTPTPTNTQTPTPTRDPEVSPSQTPTVTPTVTPTNTQTPTSTSPNLPDCFCYSVTAVTSGDITYTNCATGFGDKIPLTGGQILELCSLVDPVGNITFIQTSLCINNECPQPQVSQSPTQTPTNTKTPTPTPTPSATCSEPSGIIINSVPANTPPSLHESREVVRDDLPYSFCGISRVFENGYDTYGNSLGQVITLPINTIWSTSNTNNPQGLTRASVWTPIRPPTGREYAKWCNSPNRPVWGPDKVWIGFTHCITTNVPKKIYVGAASKDSYAIRHNGVTIVNRSLLYLIDTSDYGSFTLYPVMLHAGTNIIEMLSIVKNCLAFSVFEIYDTDDINVLINTTNINQLPIIFSTENKKGTAQNPEYYDLCYQGIVTFTFDPSINSTVLGFDIGNSIAASGYTCPSGYVYDSCTNNCVEFQYVVCGPVTPPPPTPTNYYYDLNTYSDSEENPNQVLITLKGEPEFTVDGLYTIELYGLQVCVLFTGSISYDNPLSNDLPIQFIPDDETGDSCHEQYTPEQTGIVYSLTDCSNPENIKWGVGQLDLYGNGTTLFYEGTCYIYSLDVTSVTLGSVFIDISNITKNNVYIDCYSCQINNYVTPTPTNTVTPTPTQTE